MLRDRDYWRLVKKTALMVFNKYPTDEEAQEQMIEDFFPAPQRDRPHREEMINTMRQDIQKELSKLLSEERDPID